jgi:hypothetical protein
MNMRRLLTTICFLSFAMPASAWELRSIKDPATNELVKSASVTAIGASLVVACTNGQQQPRLRLDQTIEPKNTKNTIVSYRFDDGAVTQHMAVVSADGHELWPWPSDYSAAVWKLRRVKRFRLDMGQTSFDFDLSTGDHLPAFLC